MQPELQMPDHDIASLKRTITHTRMRQFATGLLVIMLAILVLAHWFLSVHPLIGYVRAFAEAAVVGALADWFAVTALFRQPLGLPIPHTAIVPRNKERIGRSLGLFVEQNFAAPEVVSAKLADVDLAGNLAEWLSQPGRIDVFSDYLTRLIPQLLDSLDEHHLRRLASGDLREHARYINIGPLLQQAVIMLTAEKRHHVLLDKLLREADAYVTANEPQIRQRIHEKTTWLWQRLSMDEKVADGVVSVLREILADIGREPAHPLRLKLDNAIEKLASELATSPEYREQIDIQVRKLLDHPELRSYVKDIWRDIRSKLREDANSTDSAIRSWLRETMGAAIRSLLENNELRQSLNAWMQNVVVEEVQSHQHKVGTMIAETIRGWDTETVTHRIEQQVGEDLQYIRINGTVIGGLVGLIIYTLSQAFA
jgi:uncharacterized membrane-anchored protein YjiN (DUF445 family)